MFYLLLRDYDPKNKAILGHNDYDSHVCENCGAVHVTYKGVFHFKIMGKFLDYYSASGTPVISQRFLDVLRENGFTGYEVSETAPNYGTATMIGDSIKEKYYLLKVTGKCGLMCDQNGEPLPYCRICKSKVDSVGLVTTGISFAPDAYDGSDLVAFDNWNNIPVVSEKVKDALTKSKLTEFKFVPLTEYVYDEHAEKEYAIKRISKGTAFPELIEAWLKYGVLTEQELNEQMNKEKNN